MSRRMNPSITSGSAVRIAAQTSMRIATRNPIASIRSGVCTKCGYEEDTSCQHNNTYTSWDGCDWEEICRDCGEVVDWGTSHGSYSYGDWEYYSTSPASAAYGTCDDCGGGRKISIRSPQHKHGNTMSTMIRKHTVEKHCSVCNSDVGSSTTQNHSLKYGSWENDSDTQHRRSATCSLCGYSGYTYANHSFKYGSVEQATAIASTDARKAARPAPPATMSTLAILLLTASGQA